MDKVTFQKLSRYKYRLTATHSYMIPIKGRDIYTPYISLEQSGKLSMRQGYAWNGASFVVDTDSTIVASLIHDALYQLIRENHLPYEYRKPADQIFRDVCIRNGTSKFRANYFYKGLRWFAFRAAKPGRDMYSRTIVKLP